MSNPLNFMSFLRCAYIEHSPYTYIKVDNIWKYLWSKNKNVILYILYTGFFLSKSYVIFLYICVYIYVFICYYVTYIVYEQWKASDIIRYVGNNYNFGFRYFNFSGPKLIYLNFVLTTALEFFVLNIVLIKINHKIFISNENHISNIFIRIILNRYRRTATYIRLDLCSFVWSNDKY